MYHTIQDEPSSPKTPTMEISSPASKSSWAFSQPCSGSSGGLSETLRLELIRISGDLCWACSSYGTQVCQVFRERDTRDDLWAHMGLMNYSPHSLANAILLCPACHMHFDRDNDPAFLLVPTDLDYFIRFEQDDRIRRQEVGWPPGRQIPTSAMYTAYLESSGKGREGYTPVFLKYYLHNMAPPPYLTLPKYWQGAPAAVLQRCIMALGSGRIVSLGHQVAQLETLRNLYFSPIEGTLPIDLHDYNLPPQANPPQYEDPPAPNPPLSEQTSDCEIRSSDSQPEADPDTQVPDAKDPDFNPENHSRHNNRKRKGKDTSAQGTRKHAKRGTGPTSYHSGRENWVLGPMATSEDAILRYSPIFARE
ncbi:hypothetical protein N7466_003515 [Penicillium verhagenii]|uniref:uncharacterized protein n=1 Tax=Penicillium verhagenii TaxID=1562060 RepID=UPI0025456A23|nr:uncharacterized protein N7466_003515 [Penicillium verhagenii]KAJ5937065.1 hypothetical protein N7466_003515 [Penicillium verhagenii]